MPYRANYPNTVAEVLRNNATFNPATLAAVRALARAKPWRLSPDDRLARFNETAVALAAAYGIPAPTVKRLVRLLLSRRQSDRPGRQPERRQFSARARTRPRLR
jgi:hypothetical protein